jgi:hypothetical protein
MPGILQRVVGHYARHWLHHRVDLLTEVFVGHAEDRCIGHQRTGSGPLAVSL